MVFLASNASSYLSGQVYFADGGLWQGPKSDPFLMETGTNMGQNTENMLRPYRILDLTNEQGYLCGKLLGALGADVIKIEAPTGDPGRNIGPFFHDIPDPEKSLYWLAFNTDKRGITLDVETSDGQEIFKRLVRNADIVIESFSQGIWTS
jgi:crotonobetainyl-CoA:carnitine CoA-transferase CaiB-like acyl-CoA transferase